MKKKTKAVLGIAAVSCCALSAAASEVDTNAAVMQAMDKVTGRVNKITVPVNSEIRYGDFSLVLRACKTRPAEETPENFAFVDVTDKSLSGEEYNIFRGWILSSTPGLNAIEHPIYDMWLLECVDTEVDKKTLLSSAELDKRDSLPVRKKPETVVAENQTAAVEEDNSSASPKVIHINEFINEDKDIEKGLKQVPTYISEPSASYISDIEEGQEPENLLLFTKIQEISEGKISPQADED